MRVTTMTYNCREYEGITYGEFQSLFDAQQYAEKNVPLWGDTVDIFLDGDVTLTFERAASGKVIVFNWKGMERLCS